MKQNELRVGNITYHSAHSEPGTPFYINNGFVLDSYYKDLIGIPLTEEWLVEFNFKKDEKKVENKVKLPDGGYEFPHGATRYVLDEYKAIVHVLNGKFYYELSRSSGDISDEYFLKEIEFFHQLQNLYYALNGEELYKYTLLKNHE